MWDALGDSPMLRREFLASTAALAGAAIARAQQPQPAQPPAGERRPTQFQIACMTIVYSRFPLERALVGLQTAGYRYCAWGTDHMEEGNRRVPVIAPNASADDARALARRCRDRGLEPLMMFSGVVPEANDHLDV